MKKKNLMDELFIPSPSGVKKLLAAWDSFSFMDKLIALDSIRQNSYPKYLYEELYRSVIADENGYIRYIAVKNFKFHLKNKED